MTDIDTLDHLLVHALPGPYHVVEGQLSNMPHRVNCNAATIEAACAALNVMREDDAREQVSDDWRGHAKAAETERDKMEAERDDMEHERDEAKRKVDDTLAEANQARDEVQRIAALHDAMAESLHDARTGRAATTLTLRELLAAMDEVKLHRETPMGPHPASKYRLDRAFEAARAIIGRD